MYFECNDWLYGTYLTKLPFWKGIYTLLFGYPYAKFVPSWRVVYEVERTQDKND